MPFSSKKGTLNTVQELVMIFCQVVLTNFVLKKISFFAGKSLILECLKERGERVLHLEELANHKGSVLG